MCMYCNNNLLFATSKRYNGHCPLYCMLCTAACLCHGHCPLYRMLCTATCLCHGHCCLYCMLCTAACLCHGHCRLYCMLCTATCLCHGHCCLYCMLCTATCLCHRHCTVTVSCLLWQCCLTLYVVHTLPPGFPLWALLLYMEYNLMLGALRMCCHMTHY